MSETAAYIASGRASVGIEFGSTRIKAVMIGEDFSPLAMGAHDWENRLEDGYWTYSLSAIEEGLRDAYAKMAADAKAKYGVEVTRLAALGISGMMHGYLPFDAAGNLLAPFRTWRNTTTAQAAAALSGLLKFNIPQRWSVAHYYQALLNKEEHVSKVAHLTTLAGYVHRKLCGENVLGVGEASGMFPIDPETGDYDRQMLDAFDSLMVRRFDGLTVAGGLKSLLPKVLCAGSQAGTLSEAGAAWLDPTGRLQAGAVMAPPEGDAGTGMVATNAVAPRTGNVSAGTSIFAMVVLEHAMKGYYPEIDVVTTPTGKAVAMVHCNNCTNEINAWAELFRTFIETGLTGFGEMDGDSGERSRVERAEACRESSSSTRSTRFNPVKINPYRVLFNESLKGDADCGGVVVVPFLSGEPVAGTNDALLKVVRQPDSRFTLANFMRAQIYSAFVSLKLGMDILSKEEGVKIDALMGHGGIFKDKGIAQQYLADALNTPVTCMATATEGGPWGMAVLAAYARDTQGLALEDYLATRVFASAAAETLAPDPSGVTGFAQYALNFKNAIEHSSN